MKKKIVQFIRSSDNIENIVKYPAMLGKKLGHDIELFMILETRQTYFHPISSPVNAGAANYEFELMLKARRQKAEANLKEFTDKYNSVEGNPHITYTILNENTEIALIEKSGRPDTYMILINEAQEPEQGFIINTYLNIIDKTKCPVFKVPENYQDGAIDNILYATDYKSEDIPTLKKLVSLAAPFKADITALHICDSVELEEKMLSESFESSIHDEVGYNHIHMAIKEDKNVANGVIDYTKDGTYNMVVVLKENKNFIKRLFSKSDSNKILNHSDIPVMLYHEEQMN